MLPNDLLNLIHTSVDELTAEIQTEAVARLSDHFGMLLEKEGFPKNELTLYAILTFGVRSVHMLGMSKGEVLGLVAGIYDSDTPEAA